MTVLTVPLVPVVLNFRLALPLILPETVMVTAVVPLCAMMPPPAPTAMPRVVP